MKQTKFLAATKRFKVKMTELKKRQRAVIVDFEKRAQQSKMNKIQKIIKNI